MRTYNTRRFTPGPAHAQNLLEVAAQRPISVRTRHCSPSASRTTTAAAHRTQLTNRPALGTLGTLMVAKSRVGIEDSVESEGESGERRISFSIDNKAESEEILASGE